MIKLLCMKDDILNAISPAMLGVASRSSIPVLEGLRMTTEGDEVVLTGYDLEKGIKSRFKAIKVFEQGSCVFDANQLSSIVKGLPSGEMMIVIDSRGIANISSYKTYIDIPTKSDDAYPALPVLSGNKTIKIKQGMLKKMINQVIFAVGTGEQRAILKGVSFKVEDGRLIMTALDGFKLAYRDYFFNEEDGAELYPDLFFIVPGKSLMDLMKLMNDDDAIVCLELTDRHIIVNFGDIIFFSRLIDGEAIDYNRFIPKNNKTFVTVDTSALIDSCERASLIINEKAKTPVKLLFTEGMIKVSCSTVTGSIQDEVPALVEGDEVELGFNIKYVIEALRACPEKIRLELSTPRSSMIITPCDEKDKFIYLVLPVMMKD